MGVFMLIAANILLALIAAQHIAFLVLEMFLWTHPVGRKVFGQSLEAAQSSRLLAANQGLYNGFLAAGLIWGLLSSDWSVKVFFASCVLIAGIYGGWSVKRTIFFVQGLPALVALVLLLVA
jgi:putative membrane protein